MIRRHLALSRPIAGLSALILLVLGTGCAGHNHTLFVTKSNAGLDFDAKPATSELTISRKEAVIAPSFEGGQTTPVLASFQAHAGTGTGGLENFFLGVDQTFAGGEAAVAMAQLFDSPVAAPTDQTYDATLELTEKPKHDSFLRGLNKPGYSRPFIFGTDTMVGLKVGWSGVGGQIPDTLKAGFNRKEFAWAPLSITPNPDKSPGAAAYQVHMPSFLASIESDVKTSGRDIEGRAVQYFATGKAATQLARQPTVRRAMLSRMDPAFQLRPGTLMLTDTLVMVQGIIDELAKNDDAAKSHQTKLATLTGITLPTSYGTSADPYYSKRGDVLYKNERPPTTVNPSIDSLIDYVSRLKSNIKAVDDTLTAMKSGTGMKIQDGPSSGTQTQIDDTVRAGIIKDQLADEKRLERLQQEITANREIVAAYFYALQAMMAP